MQLPRQKSNSVLRNYKRIGAMAKGNGESAEQFANRMNMKFGSKPDPIVLEQVHAVFRKWLGDDYDIGALNAVLAVAASKTLSGDPAWLLIISGPGNAKTETCQSLSKLDAHIVSTISSEGALLSGTSEKNRAKGATGGLLRKIGDQGLLIVKDFTSILSANRDTRASV